MSTDPGDLVIDPTCGSGTTAYLAEQWGRRWITIDTSRVALALARTRLMSAQFPYYLLADSPEGITKEAEITRQIPPTNPKTEGDIKKGFVYKRVPHITLKAIAMTITSTAITMMITPIAISMQLLLTKHSSISSSSPFSDISIPAFSAFSLSA